MKDSKKTYSVFDLIEDKEILTHVSAKEVGECLNVDSRVVFNYSQNGANLKRRYRITRNEEVIDTRQEWVINFEFEWEQICNFLNPKRKELLKYVNEQKKDSGVHQRKK